MIAQLVCWGDVQTVRAWFLHHWLGGNEETLIIIIIIVLNIRTDVRTRSPLGIRKEL